MVKSLVPITFFFSLLVSSCTTLPIETSSYSSITNKNLPWIAAALVTTCIIGKIIHTLYHHQTSYEQSIEACRTAYKAIGRQLDHYNNMHHHNAQMRDWELKETIVQNCQEQYPFIVYHALLVKDSWILKKLVIALNTQLKEVDAQAQRLNMRGATEQTSQLEEKLLQLAIQGEHLREYAVRTISLVNILKKRVKLFREYNDDCYNWSQGKRKWLQNFFSRIA